MPEQQTIPEQKPVPTQAGPVVSDWQKKAEKYFFGIGEDQSRILKFLENDPRVAPYVNKKKEECWYFRVINEDGVEKGLAAPKTVLRAVGDFAPLAGKTLKLSRTGDNFDTKYKAELVK